MPFVRFVEVVEVELAVQGPKGPKGPKITETERITGHGHGHRR